MKFLYKRICFFPFVIILLFSLYNPARSSGRTVRGSVPPVKHFCTVKLPRGYSAQAVQRRQFKTDGIFLDLYSSGFAQGSAVYAEVYPAPGTSQNLAVNNISFDSVDVTLSKRAWGYRALFGINPETKPGSKMLRVEYSLNGAPRAEQFPMAVAKSSFQFVVTALDLGKYSDVDYRPSPEEVAFINRCADKKKKVFSVSGPDRMGESFSHPRNAHHITSQFWSKRQVMHYRKMNGKKIRFADSTNVHRGVDLRGNAGDPVYAMADGVAVIAEPMYYEGNFIVIDHGNRIFSFFMHLSGLKVKEGETVRAGDLIGRVGSTGLSTGAHLHVSLVMKDVYVDPLSVLLLPVRN